MTDEERRAELGRFLKDRRGRLQPADVGLPATARRRVRGLRREEVALLANIGVSWYTALEAGDAAGVSTATLGDVANALRLTESERSYAYGLASAPAIRDEHGVPDQLEIDALAAIRYPAYIITATWQILACNDAFRLVWDVADELPIDAVERLYLSPAARALHGEHFRANVAPVVATIRSGIGRHPHLARLQALRDRLVADPEIRPIWDDYEIAGPLVPTEATIASPIGTLCYRTLTLPIGSAFYGIVIEVPDVACRERFTRAFEASPLQRS